MTVKDMIVLLYFSGPGKLYFGVNPNLTSGIFFIFIRMYLGNNIYYAMKISCCSSLGYSLSQQCTTVYHIISRDGLC